MTHLLTLYDGSTEGVVSSLIILEIDLFLREGYRLEDGSSSSSSTLEIDRFLLIAQELIKINEGTKGRFYILKFVIKIYSLLKFVLLKFLLKFVLLKFVLH